MRKCQLHVKEIRIKNYNLIKNLDIGWKFDKETGILYIKAIKRDGITKGSSQTRINVAYRDYDDFMF